MEFGVTAQKILIIDDNEFTVRILRHALTKAGFEVDSAYSGEEGLAQIQTFGLPDLAVVDYHMEPNMNGLEFCKKVHGFSDLPTIMLTAVSDEEIVKLCLTEQCEDYVQKPFSPDVLIARIRRVLTRFESVAAEKVVNIPVDAHMSVNFPQQTANIDGEPVPLTPIETKLLYVLMRDAGKPVKTEYLLRRIWPEELVFEDRLHVHVHRLRKKIEDKSREPYIVSKRGAGYTFRLH